MVNAGGAMNRQLGLTDAQKSAIYNVVLRQHPHGAPGIPGTVPSAVGAAVSRAAELAALPSQAVALASVGDSADKDLKYAMVEDDLVMVDPVSMRVVEIIHRNARP
jgi:hypothetical protein